MPYRIPTNEALTWLSFRSEKKAYDYTGSWDPHAGHQANLYRSSSNPNSTPFNTASVIDVYTAQGVPASKIVLGMPLYGRAFTNTDGPGKPYQGGGEGSWEAGVWDYKALPQPGATEHLDAEAGASYSYDPSSRTMVSYDNLDMVKRKAAFVREKGLGGAMWWELSGDRQDERSLVAVVCFDSFLFLFLLLLLLSFPFPCSLSTCSIVTLPIQCLDSPNTVLTTTLTHKNRSPTIWAVPMAHNSSTRPTASRTRTLSTKTSKPGSPTTRLALPALGLNGRRIPPK